MGRTCNGTKHPWMKRPGTNWHWDDTTINQYESFYSPTDKIYSGYKIIPVVLKYEMYNFGVKLIFGGNGHKQEFHTEQ